MSDIPFPTLQSSNWQMTRTPQFSTLVQYSASGVRGSAALQSAPTWKWTLKNGVLQSQPAIEDLQAIQSFINTLKGMYDSFLWTDPELGTEYRVALLSDSADFERFAYQLWQLGTLSFQQVKA